MSLIEVSELHQQLQETHKPLIFDCSFDLVNPHSGYESYLSGHIPGAIYCDLDKDLAGTKNGENGRHPLPSLEQWCKTYAELGITPDHSVVVYDRQGSMFAVRLWWMLKSSGHHKVAVLNGAYGAWLNEAYPTQTEENPRQAKKRTELHPFDNLVLVTEVENNLKHQNFTILDARANDRFRGENETLDPAGGHIPGALNRFFKDNLEANGKFKSAEILREEFKAIIKDTPAEKITHQCGSGVTACHNLLAMEIAGLQKSKIYSGSWSEWSANPLRPIEK
jgi:thiosulfate/3-mercaptopyruvate sulfurtransferase